MRNFLCVAVLLALTPLACEHAKDAAPTPTGKPVHISSRVAAQTTDFAFSLLHEVNEQQPPEENIFISPLSLHIALGMLVNGAENETRAEILSTLESAGTSLEELNTAYAGLMKGLPEADNAVELGLFNSAWILAGFPVKSSFKEVLAGIFKADIYTEDFADDATPSKINQWAGDKTKGKITKVIDRINPGDVLFLLNALYFKGDWKYRFEKAATKDHDFILTEGGPKKVPMMTARAWFRFSEGETYEAVELPYASGQYNFTLLLPKPGVPAGKVVEALDGKTWAALQEKMTPADIQVGLPKFTLDYEIRLNKILTALGMERAFATNAQFGGIAAANDLHVSFVKQNTYLGIDEKGTEAAAVTSIGVSVTSLPADTPRYVIADRPFLFVISEKTSNTILFTGRIMNP